MKITITCANIDCGSHRNGANLAPQSILNCGLLSKLNTCNNVLIGDVIEQGLIGQSSPKLKNWQQVSRINKQIFDSVGKVLDSGAFSLMLGGDHSISTGAILATSKHYGNIGVIWIDAHGDWNNQDSTPSGNMHGMSFSATCGQGPDCMSDYGKDYTVNPRNCVIIGARDFDKQEAKRIQNYGVTVFTAQDVSTLGVDNVVQQALKIATQNTNGLYLSCDIDAVSPRYAPGTGTPVDNGLTPQQIKDVTYQLVLSNKVLSMDMVEVNPTLDTNNVTSELACEIIANALNLGSNV